MSLRVAIKSLGLMLALASSSAWAHVACTAPMPYPAAKSSSAVYIVVESLGIWPLCDRTNASFSGITTISPDWCRAWYAALITEQKTAGIVTCYSGSAANIANGPECTALVSSAILNPAPYHMDIGA